MSRRPLSPRCGYRYACSVQKHGGVEPTPVPGSMNARRRKPTPVHKEQTMPGSFSAGLSGLNANSAYLSVIGNNLANINTVGFKASSVTFQDLVSQSVGGSSVNPMQIGLGVTTGSISPVFSQGAIENSREATNVAIQGNGFFVVRGTAGNSYTRAGNFTFNSEGKLVTPDGQFVQGFMTTDP